MASRQTLTVRSQNLGNADRTVTGVATPASSNASIANLTVTYDLDFATLLSSSGWIDRKDFYQYDLTSSFKPYLEAPTPFGFGYPTGTFSSIAYQNRTSDRIFAQEVRLTSKGDGPVSWTVGGMYRKSTTQVSAHSIVTPDIVPITLLRSSGTSPSDSDSGAVFGELAWRFAPRFELTLGGRYFQDQRTQKASSITFGAATSDTGDKTFSTFSPRLNLKWTPGDNWSLYANAGKGFRSGGFNSVSSGLGLVTVPPTYAPDTLWSYEVGGQFRSDDRRLRAELSIYYNDWTDVQSLAFATGFPIQYVINGSKIGGTGIDAAVQWQATSDLKLSFTGGCNNMSYQNTTGEHPKGDRPDYVPRYSASIAADYALKWTANIPGFVRLDYQIADGWQVYPHNILPAAASAETEHSLNARIGADFNTFKISVFGKNLLDENKVVYPAFASLAMPMRSQPLTIGLSIAYDF